MMTLTISAALVIWLYLLLAQDRFWLTWQRLARDRENLPTWPPVLVVIPACDEADVIERAVRSLPDQDHRERLDTIVVDDGSIDGTDSLVEGLFNLTTPLLLLTDADIVYDSRSLSTLVEKMVNDKRGLLLLIPPILFFFQMFYPFPAVNNSKSPIVAAAGGCVLVRREALNHMIAPFWLLPYISCVFLR